MSGRECPVCDDGFGLEKAVRDHAWDAHDACHHCGDTFGDRDALYTHWLAAHGEDLSGTESSGGVLGVVLGTLGAGCAACGSAALAGILSLFGAGGLLTLLPLDGLEFSVLALVVLLLSIYWVAEGLRGGRVNGCPVEVGR